MIAALRWSINREEAKGEKQRTCGSLRWVQRGAAQATSRLLSSIPAVVCEGKMRA